MIETPVYSQRDPRWAKKTLGFSTETIGKSGCAVASLAMLISATHPPEENVTPLMVNTALRDGDAFGGPARNLVSWTRVQNVYHHLSYAGRIDAASRPLKRPEKAEIDARLMRDVPVLCYVDAKKQEPGLQQHFVLIVAHDPDSHDYIIADPFYGCALPLCSRYGPTPEIAICGLILYEVS